MERQLISQSHAARLKGVSRQRINELIKLGRLTLAESFGKRGLWLDEVEALQLKAVGRPRLGLEVLKAREGKFRVGDRVEWEVYSPYLETSLPTEGKVVKVSPKKLRVEIVTADGQTKTVLVDQTKCQLLPDVSQSQPASDNEGNGKIPGIREKVQTGNT